MNKAPVTPPSTYVRILIDTSGTSVDSVHLKIIINVCYQGISCIQKEIHL